MVSAAGASGSLLFSAGASGTSGSACAGEAGLVGDKASTSGMLGASDGLLG